MQNLSNLNNLSALGMKGSNLFNPSSISVGGVKLLKQQLLTKQAPTLGGIVYDERTNKGTPRPVQTGRCYDFNGSNNVASYTGTGLTFNGSQGFSISFWANPDNLTGLDKISFQLNNSTGSSELLLVYAVSTTGKFGVFSPLLNAGTPILSTANNAFQVGTWKHYMVTYNSSTQVVNMFVNGVLFHTQSSVANTYTSQSDVRVYVGARVNTQYYDGKMFGITMWHGDMTSSIASIYANRDVGSEMLRYLCDEQTGTVGHNSAFRGLDLTLNNITIGSFHATQNIFSWQNDIGYSQYMYFDGNNDRVNIPIVWTGRTNVTIKFKINTTDTNGIFFSDGTDYIGSWLQGNSSTSINFGSGTPTITINGVLFTGTTRGDMYTAIADGTTKEVVITNANMSAYTTLNLMHFVDASGFTSLGSMWDFRVDLTSDGTDDHRYFGYGNTNADWIDRIGTVNGTVIGSPSNILIPKNESNTTLDVYGQAIQFTGEVPYDADLENASCTVLNGTTQYWNIPDNSAFDITTNLSVTARGKNASATTAGFEHLAGKWTEVGNQREWVLAVNSDEKPYVALSGTGASVAVYTATNAIDLSKETSYGFTYTGGVVKLYVNGVVVAGSVTTGSIPASIFNGTSPVTVGAVISGSSSNWNGSIWDTRIFKDVVLTDAEMLAIHSGTETTLGATKVAHYPMAEVAGNIIYDVISTNHGTGVNAPTRGTQNSYFYNAVKGFSRYDHASLADILVPYSSAGTPLSITPPSGYTKLTDNPAGAYHNGAESVIDFTGNVLSPVAVINSWETNWAFNSARTNPEFKRTLTQSGVDYRADRFLAYSETLSGSNLSKVNKYVTTKAI